MEFVRIGKIVNTHGIKGELRIRSDFEKKELAFKVGMHLYLGKEKIKQEITGYRRHKEFDMVTFKGYQNINDVLNFLKMGVYVNREDLSLSSGEYLLEDLIGMEVEEDGEFLGKISDFVYNSNNILLVVEGKKRFYIPYQGNYIEKVSREKKKIYTKQAKDLIL